MRSTSTASRGHCSSIPPTAPLWTVTAPPPRRPLTVWLSLEAPKTPGERRAAENPRAEEAGGRDAVIPGTLRAAALPAARSGDLGERGQDHDQGADRGDARHPLSPLGNSGERGQRQRSRSDRSRRPFDRSRAARVDRRPRKQRPGSACGARSIQRWWSSSSPPRAGVSCARSPGRSRRTSRW